MKSSGNEAERRPNIVWLVQDHVVWKHYRDTAGPKPSLPTYERLLPNSMEFARAYTPIPLCGPARCSMMTGVYPHKHGVLNNGRKVQLDMDPSSQTGAFSSSLLEQGYRAGYFGKWHAGTGTARSCGFEGFSLPDYGNPYGTKEYADYLERRGLPEPLVDIEWRVGGERETDVKLMERGLQPNPKFGIGHPVAGVLKTPVETYEAYFLADMASRWIEERAEDQAPFAVRVDVWGPHQPYLVAEPFKDKINPRDIPEYPNFRNTFADRPAYHQQDRKEWREKTGFTAWEQWQPVVARAYEHFSQTDTALIQILDTLERTGLADNTIVVYTADHGDILASNGGLFDKDSMLTEETMTIPLVVRWPGVTDGKRNKDALVTNMDIVPTVLEWAGCTVPPHMDGRSLVPLMSGAEEGEPWREELMAEHYGHVNYEGVQKVLYWQGYKFVAHLDDSDELYDLERDPFEMSNRIQDPAMLPVLNEMKRRLADVMKKTGDDSEEALRIMREKLQFAG